jgi:hypothetical protein
MTIRRTAKEIRRTSKEIARLTWVSMRLGSYHISATERQFVCPVAYEAKPSGSGVSHRFSVHHMPWEKPDRVPVVKLALASHLADAEINGEPCEEAHLRRA